MRWVDIEGLLEKKDSEGNPPGWFFLMTNRSSGKTCTSALHFLPKCVNDEYKICLICRHKTNVGSIAAGRLSEAAEMIWEGSFITEEKQAEGAFSKVFLNVPDEDEGRPLKYHIGYVCPLSMADKLKDYSSELNKIDIMILDEFQAEKYLKDEVDKLLSIHTTIARGQGQPTRYVPILMMSNSLSIENPYFRALGLSSKIKSNTRWYRAPGVVLNRWKNDNVSTAQSYDPVNKAVKSSKLLESNIDNAWLNDDQSMIVKKPPQLWGMPVYRCTIVDGNDKFGLWKYDGYLWLGRKVDETYPFVASIDRGHDLDIPSIDSIGWIDIVGNYARGRLAFSDMGVKSIFMEKVL